MNLKELIASGASEKEIRDAGGSEDDVKLAARIKAMKDANAEENTKNEKFGEVKSVDEKERTLEGIASTEQVDRDGDVIRQAGWDLKNFKKNPVMPWGHDYRIPPIAKITKIWVEGKKLLFKAKFPEEGVSELADEVFGLFKEGIMKTFSVGFRGLEWEPNGHCGLEFTKCELLEVSAVTVPSNPGAVAKAIEKLGIDKSKIGDYLKVEETEENDDDDLKKKLRKAINCLDEKSELLEKSHAEIKAYRKSFKILAKLMKVKNDNEIELIKEVLGKAIGFIAQKRESPKKKSKSPEATPRAATGKRPSPNAKQIQAIVERVVSKL